MGALGEGGIILSGLTAVGYKIHRKGALVPLVQSIFDMDRTRKVAFSWGLVIVGLIAGLPLGNVHWTNRTPAQQRIVDLYRAVLIALLLCAIAVTVFAVWKGVISRVRASKIG
jgi:hypothetical protein